MHILRTIMFDDAERDLFGDLRVLINVAFPLARDPLTPPGEGVADDDPRRKVLIALANNRWEPITRYRLDLAVETLTVLLDAVTAQADPDWWRSRVADRPLSPTEEAMTVALTEERARQSRQAQEALDLVTAARNSLSPDDDPKVWAARHYAV